MKPLKHLTLILTVLFFVLAAEAQTINANQNKNWPAQQNTASAETDSNNAEISIDGAEVAATEIPTAESEEKADIAGIDEDLQEIDDLLATPDSSSDYEVLETQYIDGQPVTRSRKVSEKELQEIINQGKVQRRSKNDGEIASQGLSTQKKSSMRKTTKKSRKKVSTKGKRPKRRIVRRVLRRKPVTRIAAPAQSSKTSTTVVRTRRPVIKKKKNTRFHLTPVIGASYGRIQGDYLTNIYDNSLESDFGLTGGLLAEYHPSDKLIGFETGILYNQTTVSGNGNLVSNSTLDYALNEYLMFPLNLKLYPVRQEAFDVYLKGGISAGVLLLSTLRQDSNNISSTTDSSELFKDGEFQWQIGAGARIKITNEFAIAIDSFFYRSFADITDSSNATQGGEAVNTGLSTTAGIVISL